MDKTVEVSQAARDAAATAYAWQRGAMEEHHASILAGTLDCHPLVDLFARFEATTRATQPEAALREALERIDGFVRKYFEPWGSWKTAWWEGEVSDEAAFSDHNALMHVANLARAVASTLSPAERSPESREGVIEECAKVAEAFDDYGECGECRDLSSLYVKTVIASAIRALSAPAHD